MNTSVHLLNVSLDIALPLLNKYGIQILAYCLLHVSDGLHSLIYSKNTAKNNGGYTTHDVEE